ncbi:MAG: nickel pincer cofactor biosynthesis protein LarC [Micropruina sp.]|nr:nickel pincer cofactor biosynthesis protein LarC [Micropruina sp.]
MLLGALLDAGADLTEVVAAIEAVLPDTVRLTVHTVHRAGLRATKVDVTPLVDDHHHRDWTTIRALITAAPLPQPVRTNALAVFAALAAAEAEAHGIDVERVHFHEVGAWDSIADVVGVCAAVHDLGLSRLSCGVIGLGSGTVRAAHGEIPVPVPAVVQLALGWRVTAGGQGELATPTGVALLTTLCEPSPTLPTGVLDGVGIGAGTRDDPGRPNVVRVLLGRFDATEEQASHPQRSIEISTNVDDLDPRLWPEVLTRLLSARADDAWLVPILMKKGRPAHTLHVLADAETAPALRDLIVELVPTLGVREHAVTKWVLDRRWVEVEVDGHSVRIKLGLRDGEVLTATPEFADVAAAALALGRTQRDVLTAAIGAWERSVH